jgi:hypothetical protein
VSGALASTSDSEWVGVRVGVRVRVRLRLRLRVGLMIEGGVEECGCTE